MKSVCASFCMTIIGHWLSPAIEPLPCLVMKASPDVVTEIDVEAFGVKLRGGLLRRASKVLSDLSAFGDLELRSAWLYYGSMTSAAKALSIPNANYAVR
jgi:hypothetical protein